MDQRTDLWRLSGSLPSGGIQHVLVPEILLDSQGSLESICAAIEAASGLNSSISIVPHIRTPSMFKSLFGMDRVRRLVDRCEVSVIDALKDVGIPMNASLASLSASDRMLIAIAMHIESLMPILFDGTLIDFRGAVRICRLLQRLRPEHLTIWVSSAEQPYSDAFRSIDCLRSPLRLFA